MPVPPPEIVPVPGPAPAEEAPEQYGVTTLELFFDLVFVFAVTQLTGILVGELSLTGLAQVVLAFGVLWWMYGGYAWLTNCLPPATTPRRLLLLAGMAGFLMTALATPYAFTGGGVVWGVGYLIVVLVHGALYLQVTRSILRVLPGNVLAAGLVIAAGLLDHGPAVYVLWTLALLVPILMPHVVPPRHWFPLRAEHIVERHGLLVLITFGESIIAIGIGVSSAGHGPPSVALVAAGVLSLALVATLWWTYFAGDDERVEESLTAAERGPRTAMILNGYFYAHIPIVIGVIAMAAGLKKVLSHAWEPLHSVPAALALSGGVALYLVGNAWFRRIMGIGPSRLRLAAAVLALATTPLGEWIAETEVIALVAILTGALVLEGRRRPAAGGTAASASTTWDNRPRD
ncbi:low temperature requirement protein A [Actinomadura scrupuli]|uniref:low temperature requirement protein A n=1 Tax=Actinomadura scrupuli TaxID=559629 RepID=UPI003D99624B